MTRSSTRGLALLGAGAVAALLFAARAVVPTAASAVTLPDPTIDQPISAPAGQQTIVFAGGCFWGVQAVFQHVKGVVSATSGYAGSVRVVFDTSQVSLGQLLKVFFSVAHDPTELNRQGPDVGTQYRSAVFYTTPAQEKIVDAYIAQLKAAKVFKDPIVTEVKPLRGFHEAEAYHQNYYNLHPAQQYIVINDRPKVEALKAQFSSLWK